MATFEVDIDDRMADLLRSMLPPGWTVEDWLAMRSEEAIARTRLKVLREGIRSDAAGDALTGSVDIPTDALRTNDDGPDTVRQHADTSD